MEERRPYKAEVGGSSPPVPILQGGLVMEKNLATWDRVVRVVLGLVFIYLAFANGGLWWILGIIGLVLIGTAITGFCLLYKVIGFRTG